MSEKFPTGPTMLMRERDKPPLHTCTDMYANNEVHTDLSPGANVEQTRQLEACVEAMPTLDQDTNNISPEFSEMVLQPFTKMFEEPFDVEVLKKKMEAYPIPANAKMLKVPKLNGWLEEKTTTIHKQHDLDLQNIQSYMVATMSAITAQAQILENLKEWAENSSHSGISAKTGKFANAYDALMDANHFMTRAMYDTNQVRREIIKQGLSNSLLALFIDEHLATPQWLTSEDGIEIKVKTELQCDMEKGVTGVKMRKSDFVNDLSKGPAENVSDGSINEEGLNEVQRITPTSRASGVGSVDDSVDMHVFEPLTPGSVDWPPAECSMPARDFSMREYAQGSSVEFQDIPGSSKSGLELSGNEREDSDATESACRNVLTVRFPMPYMCRACSESFSELNLLKQHLEIHIKEDPFSCPECGKINNHQTSLKEHMRTHNGERPYICLYCGKRFIQIDAQCENMRTHTGLKPHVSTVCRDCGHQAMQAEHLRNCMLTHTGEHSGECSECGYRFSPLRNLKSEMSTQQGGAPEDCPTTASKPDIISVTSQVIPENITANWVDHKQMPDARSEHTRQKPYIRPDCGKSFAQSSNLNTCLKTHTGEKPFMCPDCGKGFNLFGKLKIHKQMHTGEKPYACPHCSDRFSQMAMQRRHIKTHTGERLHVCVECVHGFTRLEHLEEHLLTHTGGKPHMCSECGQGFTQVSSLKMHILTHTAEKHHACSDCGETFTEMDKSQDHMESHSDKMGERPHVCSQYGKRFGQVSRLKTHLMTHTGGKPCTCSDCGEGFRDLSDLTKHMRVHTGEKPYVYSECGKTFNELGNLKAHKKAHGVEMSQLHSNNDLSDLNHLKKCMWMWTDAGELANDEIQHKVIVIAPQGSVLRDTLSSMPLAVDISVGQDLTLSSSNWSSDDLLLSTQGSTMTECRVAKLEADSGTSAVSPEKMSKELTSNEDSVNATSVAVTSPKEIIWYTHDLGEIKPESSGVAIKASQASSIAGRMGMGKKLFKCNICYMNFSNVSELKLHAMTHAGGKTHVCAGCGTGFKNADRLAKHVCKHACEKPQTCPMCDEQFKELGKLKQHMLNHTGVRVHKCSMCDKRFPAQSQLRAHMSTHNRKHTCSECGKTFRHQGELTVHMRTHTGEKPLVFSDGGTAFGQSVGKKRYMKMHQKSSSVGKPKSHPDQVPGDSITGPSPLKQRMLSRLKQHLQTKAQANLTPQQSPDHGQGLSLPNILESHVNAHMGEKPYKCLECGEVFRNLDTLTVHMDTHVGSGPQLEFLSQKAT